MKAEERAFEKYPAERGHMHDRPYQREGFIEGYHQAEKDLALTWRDLEEIVEISNSLEKEWLSSTPWDGIKEHWFYQEVLKRFKDYKERKEQ